MCNRKPGLHAERQNTIVEVIAWVVQGAGTNAVPMSSVSTVSVTNPQVGARLVEQHECKVFCTHGGLQIAVDSFCFWQSFQRGLGQFSHFWRIDGGWILSLKCHLRSRAERRAKFSAQLSHLLLDQVERFDAEGSDRSLKCGLVWNDVDGLARLHLRDR